MTNHLENISDLTPKQIVEELDRYIIGQKEAKKNVAIALRNRWRRMNADAEMIKEIIPNNILMIGSTGVGKTEIARRLAIIANAPFIKVEASKFTEVGYVGRDVESMVRDLAEQSFNLVKTQKKETVKVKAMEQVDEIILNILVPPVLNTNFKGGIGFETEGLSSNPDSDEYINQKTRESFLKKIKNGDLNDRKIEIEIQGQSGPSIGVMGGAVDDVSMMKIEEMIGGMMPKKTKKRKVTIAEAKKILFEEEASKLLDMDEMKEEAVWRAENLGIIFIDEIDKIANSNKGNGVDVSREGVQRDLLPIVEGSAVGTKYGIVKTDHVLFVAAGAFHVSKPSDLIPELQGRFPIRVELESLTEADFIQILTKPKNALIRQYEAMLKAEKVDIEFSLEAIEELAKIAFQINSEIENIGARRLQTVVSHLLNEIMFAVPDEIKSGTKVLIDKDLVQSKLNHLIKNRDLSQYIL